MSPSSGFAHWADAVEAGRNRRDFLKIGKDWETKMHRSHTRFSVCTLFAFAFLVVCATTVWAQTPVDSGQGVLAHSADLAANFGYSNLPGADGKNHVNFGASAGVNLTPNISILGEYTYTPMGSLSGVAFNSQLFGVATRLNFAPSRRMVPYALVGFGFDRLNGSESGVSVSANGSYVAVGGGASIYFGKGWGVRPEFRWERQDLTFAGLYSDTNVIIGTGSVFYQWGGRNPRRPNLAQK